jgi:fructosamine-3-kinase
LPVEDVQRVERLAGRLEDLVEEPNPPALVHGDVWSANVLAEEDRLTAFLDPALYHADPEVELSFIGLFNSFGAAFFKRYEEIRGIDRRFYETRRDLYSLPPELPRHKGGQERERAHANQWNAQQRSGSGFQDPVLRVRDTGSFRPRRRG